MQINKLIRTLRVWRRAWYPQGVPLHLSPMCTDLKVKLHYLSEAPHQFSSTVSLIQSSIFTVCANSLTSRTVSILTVITFPTRRTMYSSSSRLFGSLTMPLRLSSLTWYWSITQSRAERLPSRYWKHSSGMPESVRLSLTITADLSSVNLIFSTRHEYGTSRFSAHC